jgi:hypothetical protein
VLHVRLGGLWRLNYVVLSRRRCVFAAECVEHLPGEKLYTEAHSRALIAAARAAFKRNPAAMIHRVTFGSFSGDREAKTADVFLDGVRVVGDAVGRVGDDERRVMDRSEEPDGLFLTNVNHSRGLS